MPSWIGATFSGIVVVTMAVLAANLNEELPMEHYNVKISKFCIVASLIMIVSDPESVLGYERRPHSL